MQVLLKFSNWWGIDLDFRQSSDNMGAERMYRYNVYKSNPSVIKGKPTVE